MNKALKKILSLSLAVSLTASLTLPALASEALGEDLTTRETLLNEDTRLSSSVFWSSAYTDLRTEHYITYEPNRDVTPIVTYGQALTERHTVTAMAKELEAEGYRVVAGLNGDFYNVSTGLPIGLVITEGILRSSDSGYYAVGFNEDGEAVLGKPGVKVTADLGYTAYDEFGAPIAQMSRTIAGVNKSRVSTGGIYLYTYDFNAKHTNGTTEPGVDVICTIADGEFAIGETVELTVEQVLTGTKATPVGEDQVVLSVNEKSDAYYVTALQNIPVGTTVTLDITAADEAWEDVEYAVGALYCLAENGAVATNLPTGVNPRTAVGQKRDGTLIFYTIDGRRSGHSIGASLTQVGQRMVELGCETVLCLDGGGSTTLAVTEPDSVETAVVNRPSEGNERAVTNQIFLVADDSPSGRLSHFYVRPAHTHVLAGSRVEISASAVDSNYVPMDTDYKLKASDGKIRGDALITPDETVEITVTASRNGREGSATVYAIAEPDEIAVRNESGKIITELSVTPGAVVNLTGSASYRHLPLYADADLFEWDVESDIGRIDENGVFTATAPGEGVITVSAGGREAEVEVTVAKMPLQTIEGFEEGRGTIYSPTPTGGLSTSQNNNMEYVIYGRNSLEIQYSMAPRSAGALMDYTIPAGYTGLNVWVYGDGSGNTLSFRTAGGEVLPVCTLNFIGWLHCNVELPEGDRTLTAIGIEGLTEEVMTETGEIMQVALTPTQGTIYLDQMVATFGDTVDYEVPVVEAELDEEAWAVRAAVRDAVDDMLPEENLSVSFNGQEMDFDYDKKTGEVTVYLPGPGESHEAMRVTITARDGSGNIGRSSVNIEPFGVEHKFTDIGDYADADCVDFLYNSGVTTGYEDGTFRPNNLITRAQFAAMLYRYLGLEEEKYADVVLPFADVGSIAEYALPAIRALYTEGIINGSVGKDGRLYFNPNNNLTRAQVIAMVGRTQEKGHATVELNFTDNANIPAYAVYYIQTMAAQGVIGGYPDGSFKPYNLITRGQMAKILYNLM